MDRRAAVTWTRSLAAALCLAACQGGGGGEGTSAGGSGGGSGGGGRGPFALSFDELELEGDWRTVTAFRMLPSAGSNELLLLDRQGRVGHMRIDGDTVGLLGEFQAPGVYTDLDCGVLSVAFDPAFETNGFVYLAMCISEESSAIKRLVFDPADYAAIPATEVTILEAGDPAAPRPWHNIGSIGFDPQGHLWAVLGDKKVAPNGQDLTNDLSALIRISPSTDPEQGGHTPAPDNPAFDEPDASPNIYAYGLRSPWRAVLDSRGRYWFGDVGSDHFEEVNVVAAPGLNFGWSGSEGPCLADCDGQTDPIISWPHEGTHVYAQQDDDVSPTGARVAWVGLEVLDHPADPYDGNLVGKVLFGDYCQGYVRAAGLDASGTLVSDDHLGHLRFPVAWAQAPDGFLYTATFGRCETAGIEPDALPASKFYRAVWR